MIGKSGGGWQTTTADLALILFLVVSASAVDQAPAVPGSGGPGSKVLAAPTLETNPSAAVYRATAGISLSEWLGSQAVDQRQIATVLVTRTGGGPSPVVDEALVYLEQIEAAGRTGRLLMERGESDDVTVVLAYDQGPGSGMALAPR